MYRWKLKGIVLNAIVKMKIESYLSDWNGNFNEGRMILNEIDHRTTDTRYT